MGVLGCLCWFLVHAPFVGPPESLKKHDLCSSTSMAGSEQAPTAPFAKLPSSYLVLVSVLPSPDIKSCPVLLGFLRVFRFPFSGLRLDGHAATGTAVGGFTGEVMWSGIGIYSK